MVNGHKYVCKVHEMGKFISLYFMNWKFHYLRNGDDICKDQQLSVYTHTIIKSTVSATMRFANSYFLSLDAAKVSLQRPQL